MEVRRGARVATTFLVAIDGLERAPELRKGDISATGVYFETSRDVGAVGTIHWLSLVSVDSAMSLRVMAHVVRTLLLSDAGGQRIGGAAFEFMPVSDDASNQLHDFVKYVLALRRPGIEPHIASRFDAHAVASGGGTGPGASQATVRKLSVRSMVLETSWAIEPGEAVRVDIVAPGMTRRIRLDGRAVRVLPRGAMTDPASYAIEVEVQEETERPIRRHSSTSFHAVTAEDALNFAANVRSPLPPEDEDITRTLDDLLSALILPPGDASPRNRVHHLSGQLSRVRLPTLCSLFDMERMEGKLVVRRGSEEVSIFVSNGQLVDVEPLATGETCRARIKALMGWEDGSFEFYVEPVLRTNRVEVSTTALLLDLAREADEAAHDGAK